MKKTEKSHKPTKENNSGYKKSGYQLSGSHNQRKTQGK